MPEHDRRMAIERMRAHLARAESELEAAQRFLDPQTGDPAELDVVRAVANARLSVADALETVRLMMGEPGG
jgi:thiamine biosynthesis lipoprotein ApbE